MVRGFVVGVVLGMGVGCVPDPPGVLFRCEPDGTCPEGRRCERLGDADYCVLAGGGSAAGGLAGGASAGGRAGGAGGGMAGGSSGGVAGGLAGGSAGGSAGGDGGGSGGGDGGGTAGGSAGGTGGGSAGGDAGGSSGGVAGGGSRAGGAGGGAPGGGAAGGSAGGAAGGTGSRAGGVGGGTTGGGSAGGSSGGGSAGGVGGGAGGGMPVCSPMNCAMGCCGNGGCSAPSNSRCGLNGGVCMACGPTQTCQNGACLTCFGCIESSTGVCVAGTSNTACGAGGAFCANCAATGLVCQPGGCQPPAGFLGPQPFVPAQQQLRRFVSIARVPGTAGHPNPSFVTVAEPLDGGFSELQTWSTTGAFQLFTRSVSWSTEMVVKTVATGGPGTSGIGGTDSMGSTHQFIDPPISIRPLPNTGGQRALDVITGAGRLVCARGVNSTVGPLVYLTQTSALQAALKRPELLAPASFGVQFFTTTPAGTLLVDDVAAAAVLGSPNAFIVSARCQGMCAFAGSSVVANRLTPMLAYAPYDPATSGIGSAPAGSMVPLVDVSTALLFDVGSPIRLAADGNGSLYIGGQGLNGELVVRQYLASTLVQTAVAIDTTGALRLVDLIRGPTGVLVLGWINSANVSFAGTNGTLPWTPANGRNVVVVRLDGAMRTRIWTWDLPGDQLPVAFEHVNGTLAIAVNEGPNASLWLLPTPAP